MHAGIVVRGVYFQLMPPWQDLGKLKILVDGFHFKSAKTGKTLHVKESDIDELEWLRVARGYEVKVIKQDGTVTLLDGFKDSVSQR